MHAAPLSSPRLQRVLRVLAEAEGKLLSTRQIVRRSGAMAVSRAHSKSGAIKFEENTYWAPWLVDLAGQQVVIRFNQENLWEGVHVYNATGAYRGHAECREKSGYFSVEQARTQPVRHLGHLYRGPDFGRVWLWRRWQDPVLRRWPRRWRHDPWFRRGAG